MSAVPERCPRGSDYDEQLSTTGDYRRLPASERVRVNNSGAEASRNHVSVRKRTGLVHLRPTLRDCPPPGERDTIRTDRRRVTCSLPGTRLKHAGRRRRNRSIDTPPPMSKTERTDDEERTDDKRTGRSTDDVRETRR